MGRNTPKEAFGSDATGRAHEPFWAACPQATSEGTQTAHALCGKRSGNATNANWKKRGLGNGVGELNLHQRNKLTLC